MALWLACYVVAAVAFGVTVWAANANCRLQAMSAYIGAVAIATVIIPAIYEPVEEFMERFG